MEESVIRPMPISKIIFIVGIVTILLFIMWKWCAPSKAATNLQLQSQEEKEDEVEDKPPMRASEYDNFMNRLQQSEKAARERALALAEEEKRARAAEDAERQAKELARVNTHTRPVGVVTDA